MGAAVTAQVEPADRGPEQKDTVAGSAQERTGQPSSSPENQVPRTDSSKNTSVPADGTVQVETKPGATTGPVAGGDVGAAGEAAMEAIVIEVAGSVDWAAPGVSPLKDEGWTPVKVGDRLAMGSQLRTGLRSHVNLRFGETTVVGLRSATHASIDQCYRSATTERVRVGVAYGTVRGASSEGEVRSDVLIDSTVATLAKRGTEGWEMWVEPMTGRYRVSLAQSGLVEAIEKVRGQRSRSKTVAPGEYATRDNIANLWILQAVFDRNVTFYEAATITESDAEFTAANTTGYGVLAPGGGRELRADAGRVSSDFVFQQSEFDPRRPPTTAIIQPGPIVRPEGNFGTPNTFKILVPDRQSRGRDLARSDPRPVVRSRR